LPLGEYCEQTRKRSHGLEVHVKQYFGLPIPRMLEIHPQHTLTHLAEMNSPTVVSPGRACPSRKRRPGHPSLRGTGTEGPTFQKAKHGAPGTRPHQEETQEAERSLRSVAARPEERDAEKGGPPLRSG